MTNTFIGLTYYSSSTTLVIQSLFIYCCKQQHTNYLIKSTVYTIYKWNLYLKM